MTGASITESRRGNGLLWIVAAAFAVLLTAWITFIVLACRHPAAPVSITTQGGGTR